MTGSRQTVKSLWSVCTLQTLSTNTSLCVWFIRIVSVNQKFIEYCMLIIKPITHHQPIRMHFCESSENLLQTRKNQDAELSIWGKVQQKSAKRLGMYFFFFFFTIYQLQLIESNDCYPLKQFSVMINSGNFNLPPVQS